MRFALFPTVTAMNDCLSDLDQQGIQRSEVSILHYDQSASASVPSADIHESVAEEAKSGAEKGLVMGAEIGGVIGLGLGLLLITAGPLAIAPLIGLAAVGIGAGGGSVLGSLTGAVGGAGKAVIDNSEHDRSEEKIVSETEPSGYLATTEPEGQHLILTGAEITAEEKANAQEFLVNGGAVMALSEDTLGPGVLLAAVTAHGGRLI